jgi:four helix bundle protein
LQGWGANILEATMGENRFDRLDVYVLALEYFGMARPLVLRLRRTEQAMADQLQRSTLSIPLNIAEGAGEFSTGDKRKFYRYALRSAAESIAIVDACHRIDLCRSDEHERCRSAGMRLVAMLTRLVIVMGQRKE